MAVCFIVFIFIKLVLKIFFRRDDAYPGPQIGFLQEIVQWLDYHIKGIDNGYEKKQLISVFQLSPNIDELHSILNERNGNWIHFNSIPSYPNEHFQRNSSFIDQNQQICQKQIKYYLSYQCLTTEVISNDLFPKKISFLSPQETGLSSGNLLGWGNLDSPDHSIDQQDDDGRSLCFDSLPLNEHYGINISYKFLQIFFCFPLRIIWISKCET